MVHVYTKRPKPAAQTELSGHIFTRRQTTFSRSRASVTVIGASTRYSRSIPRRMTTACRIRIGCLMARVERLSGAIGLGLASAAVGPSTLVQPSFAPGKS